MWRDLKHSLMLASSVGARIAIMLAVFKYLSISFGVEGFGLLSQVMAIGSLFATFAGGGPPTGLVREVALASGTEEKARWLKAGFAIAGASAVLMIAIALVMFQFFGGLLLGSEDYSWIFLVIAAAQIPLAFGSASLGFLSGSNMPSAYAIATMAGSVAAACLVFFLAHAFGLPGGMAACALFALGPAMVGMFLMSAMKANNLTDAIHMQLQWTKMRRLISYSGALLVAGAAVPLALLHMRATLAGSAGWQAVGEWQSVARIGDAYMQAFGAIFINLMLPRMSSHLGMAAQLRVLGRFSLMSICLFVVGAAIFWFFAEEILSIVYSADFSRALPYVLPQLLADLLKIVMSLFMYFFVARGQLLIQAAGEIVQAGMMVVAFHFLFQSLGGVAAAWAYAAGTLSVLLLLVAGMPFALTRAAW